MNIAVIAAHPDDEVIGCGGTMVKHVSQGDNVHVLILAEGLTSRDVYRNRDAHDSGLSQLRKAAKLANEALGVNSVKTLDFPDNRMDSVDLLDIIKKIEVFIAEFKAEVVYTHHAGDLNIDHRRIHDAVVTACRPIAECTVKKLLFFEIASSTEWQIPGSAPVFAPNCFVDISKTLEKKLVALNEYKMEMRDWPHSRSLKALKYLSKWRGATVGVDAAEAFVVGRILV